MASNLVEIMVANDFFKKHCDWGWVMEYDFKTKRQSPEQETKRFTESKNSAQTIVFAFLAKIKSKETMFRKFKNNCEK